MLKLHDELIRMREHVQRVSYVSETQDCAQTVDDVLGEVGVFRVPHQADGDDLRRVHEHATDTKLLSTVTLRGRGKNVTPQDGRSDEITQNIYRKFHWKLIYLISHDMNTLHLIRFSAHIKNQTNSFAHK